MNIFTKSILAGMLLLTVVGCKTEFAGTIDVSQKMTVKLKKGSADVEVGSHGSRLQFKSKKKATLVIDRRGQNSVELPLTIPKNSLPEDNGRISLKAEEIDQTFDIEGDLRTVVTQSGNKHGTESCSEQVPYRECYTDSQGRRICRDGWRTVSGVRNIDYYERYFNRTVDLELRDAKSGQATARLSGKNVETERIVTHQGFCRAYGSLYDGYGSYIRTGAQIIFGR